jgi:hypothetical protein
LLYITSLTVYVKLELVTAKMSDILVPKGGTSPLFIMSSMCPTMLKPSSLEEEVVPKGGQEALTQ